MRSKPVLGEAELDRLLAAGRRAAAGLDAAVTIAIVDDGGHLLAQFRMDGASLLSVEVSAGKARTAALSRRSTALFAELVARQPQLMTIAGLTPIEGGLPLIAGADCIGGLGVSGSTGANDVAIAEAAAAAMEI